MHSGMARGRLVGLILFAIGLLGAAQAEAAVNPTSVARPFTVRYAINTNGDIALAANTLMTCQAGSVETHDGRGTARTGRRGRRTTTTTRCFVDTDSDRLDVQLLEREPRGASGATALFAGPLLGRGARPGRDAAPAVHSSAARARVAAATNPAAAWLGAAAGRRAPVATSRSAPRPSTPTPRTSAARRTGGADERTALPGVRERDLAGAGRRRRQRTRSATSRAAPAPTATPAGRSWWPTRTPRSPRAT